MLIYLEPKKERLYLIPQSNYVHPGGFNFGYVATGDPEECSFEAFRTSGMERIRELLDYARTTSACDADLQGTQYDVLRKKLSQRLGARYSNWLLSEQHDGTVFWVSKADRKIELPASTSGGEFLIRLCDELAPFEIKQNPANNLWMTTPHKLSNPVSMASPGRGCHHS